MVPNDLSVKSLWQDDAEDICYSDLASREAVDKMEPDFLLIFAQMLGLQSELQV